MSKKSREYTCMEIVTKHDGQDVKVFIEFNRDDPSSASVRVNNGESVPFKAIHAAIQEFVDKYPFDADTEE